VRWAGEMGSFVFVWGNEFCDEEGFNVSKGKETRFQRLKRRVV
jgi:hypothetical protein